MIMNPQEKETGLEKAVEGEVVPGRERFISPASSFLGNVIAENCIRNSQFPA